MSHYTDRDPALCILLLRDALIAHDLAGMIADTRPDLRVCRAGSHDEAMAHVANGDRVAVIFAGTHPQAFATSALALRVASDNGLLVYLGFDAAEQAMDDARDDARHHNKAPTRKSVLALQYPFSIDHVLGILDKVPMTLLPALVLGA